MAMGLLINYFIKILSEKGKENSYSNLKGNLEKEWGIY